MIVCSQPFSATDGIYSGDFSTRGSTTNYDLASTNTAGGGATFSEHFTEDVTWHVELGTSLSSHSYQGTNNFTTTFRATSATDTGMFSGESHGYQYGVDYTSSYHNHTTQYATQSAYDDDLNNTSPSTNWTSGRGSTWSQADIYGTNGTATTTRGTTTQTGTTWYESTNTTETTTIWAFTSTLYSYKTDYFYQEQSDTAAGHFTNSHYSTESTSITGSYSGWFGTVSNETTISTTDTFEWFSSYYVSSTTSVLTGVVVMAGTTTSAQLSTTTITCDSYSTNRVSTTYSSQMVLYSRYDDPTPSYYLTVFVRLYDVFNDDWMFSGINNFEALPPLFFFTNVYASVNADELSVLPVYETYITTFDVIDLTDVSSSPPTYTSTSTTEFYGAVLTYTTFTSDTFEDTITLYEAGSLPMDSWTNNTTRTENVRTDVFTYSGYGTSAITVTLTRDYVISHIHSDGTSLEAAYREKTLWRSVTSIYLNQQTGDMRLFIPTYLQSGYQIQPDISATNTVHRGLNAVIPMPFPKDLFVGAWVGSTDREIVADFANVVRGVSVPFGVPDADATYDFAKTFTDDGSNTWNVVLNSSGLPVFTAIWQNTDGSSGSFGNTFLALGGDCNTSTAQVFVFGVLYPYPNVVIGGRQHAEGVQTVFVRGCFASSDTFGGSGTEIFGSVWDSFTIDTSDLNGFYPLNAYNSTSFYGSTYNPDILVSAIPKHLRVTYI